MEPLTHQIVPWTTHVLQEFVWDGTANQLMIDFRPPTAYAKSLNYLEIDADDIKSDPLTTTNICADANVY